MKKIEAIIRTSKFEDVHSALTLIGVGFMTYSEVKGIGTEHAAVQRYRGAEFDAGFIHRTRLEIVVTDDRLNQIVEVILQTAHTGKVGDGKIFVYDIADVYRIRTKEKGDKAL